VARHHRFNRSHDAGRVRSPSPPTSGPLRPERGLWTKGLARHYTTLRNTDEGWNGFAKDPAHEALAQTARRRVRGIAAQGILITFLYVSANLRKIDAYDRQVANRGAVEARKRARRRRTSLKDYLRG
jgi:hypothetical protein